MFDRPLLHARTILRCLDCQQHWNLYQPLGLSSGILLSVWIRLHLGYLCVVHA
jgi:hypothetical protein